ncbi:hypothetical protein ABG067_006218 [Albugo candida]
MQRLLGPIYKAIDEHQYKHAIRLTENKKIAHIDLVQVLRAHCYERLGLVANALAFCRQAQKQNPTDETVLNTMSLVFRSCGAEVEMLPTLEYACAHSNPINEELYVNLFSSYARHGSLLKQQQTALKLYKAMGGNVVKYLCWACVSMFMQIRVENASEKVILLAEKMLQKAYKSSHCVISGEMVLILIEILKAQKKYAEALEWFDTLVPLMISSQNGVEDKRSLTSSKPRAAEGDGVHDEDIELGPLQLIDQLQLEASLAIECKEWSRGIRVYQKLLEEYDADDWVSLTGYLSAILEETDDVLVAEVRALEVLRQLQCKEKNRYLRGPFLAVIHLKAQLFKIIRMQNSSTEVLCRLEIEIADQLVMYLAKFHTKACCFSDVKQYFALFESQTEDPTVSTETKTRFLDQVRRLVDSTHGISGSSVTLAELNQYLLQQKILRFFNAYEDDPIMKMRHLVTEYLHKYHSMSFINSGAQGGQREVQHTDDLILLAAHTLLDVHQRSNSEIGPHVRYELLIDTAALLELGLANSAYNFQMKLLLCQVYGYLGACQAMLDRFTELQVKHIQQESLSYLIFDKLIQLGHLPESRQLCSRVVRLHRTCEIDLKDYIARAYRLGIYTKVIDMTTFLHNKLRKSYVHANSHCELLQYNMMEAMGEGSNALSQLFASKSFEQDLDTLQRYIAEDFAFNQHRNVSVKWSSTCCIPASDSFQQDGNGLVECDRSASEKTAIIWMRLQILTADTFRKMASSTQMLPIFPPEFAPLYREYLSALDLTNDNHTDLRQRIWIWSAGVIETLDVPAACTLNDFNTKIQKLQKEYQSIGSEICTAMYQSFSRSILSAFGVSCIVQLVLMPGLWVEIMLSLIVEKNASDDTIQVDEEDAIHPYIAGIEALCECILATLESVYAAIKDDSVALTECESNGFFTEGNTSAMILEELHRKRVFVRENVYQSHKSTITRLQNLLQDRITFWKNITNLTCWVFFFVWTALWCQANEESDAQTALQKEATSIHDSDPEIQRVREVRNEAMRLNDLQDYNQSIHIVREAVSTLHNRVFWKKKSEIPTEKSKSPNLKDLIRQMDAILLTQVLNDYGNILMRAEQYEEAIHVLEDTVSYNKKLFGSSHPSYGLSMRNLANAYFENKQYENAVKKFKILLFHVRRGLGLQHEAYMESGRKIGQAYRKLGKLEQAVRVYEKLLGNIGGFISPPQELIMYDKNDDQYPELASALLQLGVGEIYMDLANVQLQLGNLEYASFAAKQAREILKKRDGPKSLSYAFALNTLSGVKVHHKEISAAYKLMRKAHQIARKIYGDSHDIVISSKRNLEKTKKLLEKEVEEAKHSAPADAQVHGEL